MNFWARKRLSSRAGGVLGWQNAKGSWESERFEEVEISFEGLTDIEEGLDVMGLSGRVVRDRVFFADFTHEVKEEG
jgi:hypothetical protein